MTQQWHFSGCQCPKCYNQPVQPQSPQPAAQRRQELRIEREQLMGGGMIGRFESACDRAALGPAQKRQLYGRVREIDQALGRPPNMPAQVAVACFTVVGLLMLISALGSLIS